MAQQRLMSRVGYTRGSVKRMLTKAITIYRPGATTNEYGEDITGLLKIKDTMCNIEELTSRFLFQTPDFVRLTNLRWIVEVAWDEDILTGDIIELKTTGTRFEVEGVNVDEVNQIFLKVDVHIMTKG